MSLARRPSKGQLAFGFERPNDEKFCEYCGRQLERKRNTGPRSPKEWAVLRFCSIGCSQKFRQRAASKCPDAATLRDLYVRQMLSGEEIAAIYGVTPYPAYRWLRNAGIVMRAPGVGLENRGIAPPDRDELHRMVYEEFQTYEQIGERYGVTFNSVEIWLKKHGIPKPDGWHARTKGVRPIPPDEGALRDLYGSGKTIRDISLIYKVSDYFVHKWFNKYGIQKRPDGFNNNDGLRYDCDDGNQVRSSYEKRVADWFFGHAVPYQYEPNLPFGVNYSGDFLANGWYVEVWGVAGNGPYEERKRRKTEGYHAAGLPLVELNHWHFSKASASTLEKRLRKCLSPPMQTIALPRRITYL